MALRFGATAAASPPQQRPELSLDKASQNGFVGFFQSLPKPTHDRPSFIRIFERNNGEFYSVHGDDALYVAQEFYKTNSVLKNIGTATDNGLPTCTISQLSIESFLIEIVQCRHMHIEIWSTLSSAADSRKSVAWKCVKTASPGNLAQIEDLLNFESVDPVIAAVVIKQDTETQNHVCVGIAYAKASDRTLGAQELTDSLLLPGVESLLIHLNVKECLFVERGFSSAIPTSVKRLRTVVEASGIAVTLVKSPSLCWMDDFQKLVQEKHVLDRLLSDYALSSSALGALVEYLGLAQDCQTNECFRLVVQELVQQAGKHMRLDATALLSLHLVSPPCQGREFQKSTSHLYGLLNRTYTLGGARLLDAWIRAPLRDPVEIEMRQTAVRLLEEDACAQTSAIRHLQCTPDISRIIRRLSRKFAGLDDVLNLYNVASKSAPELVNTHKVVPVLSRLPAGMMQSEAVSRLQPYVDLVERTVDFEAADRGEPRVKADFDDELRRLAGELDASKAQLRPLAEQVAVSLGMDIGRTLKLENNAHHGWHFRLFLSQAGRLRGNSEYIELATLKNGVQFTTFALRTVSQEISRLKKEYEAQQASIVGELLQAAAAIAEAFTAIAASSAELDVLLAFAETRRQFGWVFPTFEKDRLELVECRHPCVEAQDGIRFIPNDVGMGKGGGEQESFLVVTGPNMGGKSTYIRMVGVCMVLAQMGCAVPCSRAVTPLMDAVMCRVSASDDQMRGMSTFMVEMLEAAAIMRSATENTLVIVDELGRGTSVHDGFGLAYAIAHHLAAEINCWGLYATHFYEMTALAGALPGRVGNRHVAACVGEAGAKDLIFMYRIAQGACDQSYGIYVAQLAGLPSSVIGLARHKLEEFERQANYARTRDGLGLEPDVARLASLEEAHCIVDEFLGEAAEATNVELQSICTRYEDKVRRNPYLCNMLEQMKREVVPF